MKKSTIIIIFILAVFSFFGLYSLQKKQLSVSNTTPTLSTPPTNNQIEKIDYSTLEKDRLYTEEEGKYENLSDVGKKLLRTVLALPDCINDPTLSYCYEYEQYTVTNSSVVALKNGILLVNVPNGKGGYSYNTYNLNKKGALIDAISYFGTEIRNNKFLVYIRTNYVNIDNEWVVKDENLLYYKPGMPKFVPIPSSELISTESYWYPGGMGYQISETSFKDGVLEITIFIRRKGDISEAVPQQIRDVTFDLNNL